MSRGLGPGVVGMSPTRQYHPESCRRTVPFLRPDVRDSDRRRTGTQSTNGRDPRQDSTNLVSRKDE